MSITENAAEGYREDLVRFLRDLIAIPAETGDEEARCRRVMEEYERLGFDECFFDELGTVVARIGDGPRVLLMDGHIDCVGIGDPASWDFDPHKGKLEDDEIWGRGAVDELPGVVCMAYGAKLLMERGVPDGLTLYLTASVMEELCEGAAHMCLLQSERVRRPDGVILGEPTNMAIYRGQRGRIEAKITLRGRAAHGAQPELGDNALYKAARVLAAVEALGDDLEDDDFLGRGTVVASDIECRTPCRNAVPDLVHLYIDRRLTAGEDADAALARLAALDGLTERDEVTLERYQSKAWTGADVEMDKAYPAWTTPADHPLVVEACAAVEDVLGAAPRVGRWSFSTNGVATRGLLGIPTVGFAPGDEDLAHTTREHVAVDDLVRATAVYARLAERFAASS